MIGHIFAQAVAAAHEARSRRSQHPSNQRGVPAVPLQLHHRINLGAIDCSIVDNAEVAGSAAAGYVDASFLGDAPLARPMELAEPSILREN